MTSGAGSRRKGHQFERDVAAWFREMLPGCHVKRGLQSRGAEEPDVCIPHFWVECKRGKKTNIKAALRQASLDTDGRRPLAICKDDREPTTVTMYLDDFLDLAHYFFSHEDQLKERNG